MREGAVQSDEQAQTRIITSTPPVATHSNYFLFITNIFTVLG
jgi:hypothetical protein